jgi:hypothetical protein
MSLDRSSIACTAAAGCESTLDLRLRAVSTVVSLTGTETASSSVASATGAVTAERPGVNDGSQGSEGGYCERLAYKWRSARTE